MEWHVICFSETRAITQDVIFSGGHRLISSYGDASNAASGTAILTHQKFTRFVKHKIIINDRIIAIDMKFRQKTIRIISIYMSHAGYAWSDFVYGFDQISILICEAIARKYGILLAGDFKPVLDYGVRGNFLNDFCAQFGLTICNRNGRDADEENWTFSNSMGVKRRVDFILCSAISVSESTRTGNFLDLGSDHRCVENSFDFTIPQTHYTLKKHNLKNWRPELNSENQPETYHRNLDKQILATSDYSLKNIGNICKEAALQTNSIDDNLNIRRPERSEELRDLIRRRHVCRNAEERRIISKRI